MTLANTSAEMMPSPEMAEAPEPRMSMSAAMDVLDEFHIKRSDYDRVYSALETVTEPADDMQAEGADPEADMAKEMFAPDRDRKAM